MSSRGPGGRGGGRGGGHGGGRGHGRGGGSSSGRGGRGGGGRGDSVQRAVGSPVATLRPDDFANAPPAQQTGQRHVASFSYAQADTAGIYVPGSAPEFRPLGAVGTQLSKDIQRPGASAQPSPSPAYVCCQDHPVLACN